MGVWAKLMGSSKTPNRPLAWQATLAGMLAHDVRAYCVCTVCGSRDDADLAAMFEAEGPRATLWDRRPVCPRCGGRSHYMAAGPHNVFRPLLSDHIWQAARYQLQQRLGFSKRDRRRIAVFAEKVDTATPNAKGLSDLDACVFVTARRMVADPIPKPYVAFGEWAGRDLLYRPFNPGERALWERRPKGPRGL